MHAESPVEQNQASVKVKSEHFSACMSKCPGHEAALRAFASLGRVNRRRFKLCCTARTTPTAACLQHRPAMAYIPQAKIDLFSVDDVFGKRLKYLSESEVFEEEPTRAAMAAAHTFLLQTGARDDGGLKPATVDLIGHEWKVTPSSGVLRSRQVSTPGSTHAQAVETQGPSLGAGQLGSKFIRSTFVVQPGDSAADVERAFFHGLSSSKVPKPAGWPAPNPAAVAAAQAAHAAATAGRVPDASGAKPAHHHSLSGTDKSGAARSQSTPASADAPHAWPVDAQMLGHTPAHLRKEAGRVAPHTQ